jgi:tetratricopeptide (TPR) repeat protein
VAFVADDLGAWLVGLLADAGRRKLTAWVLGDEQERALRQAASAAVFAAAEELRPDGGEGADELARVISEVFGGPAPDLSHGVRVTLLEALQAGVAGQAAVLDDASLTGTGRSSAEVLGLPAGAVAGTLAAGLVREIVVRGSRGGPLEPLAAQLNHDVTHLQGQRLEGMLGQLAGEVEGTLARLDAGRLVPPEVPRNPEAPESRSVRDWRPADLGIHKALRGILPADAVPELPGYLYRDHDKRLDELLADPAGGAFIVLRGGSSTGKSRALYESILRHQVLRDWPLSFPRNGRQARKALDDALPVPGVLWLGDCYHLVSSAEGADVAADLAALLGRSMDGPVVVVATLWRDHWESLTAESAAPGPVRDLLLDQATVVDVPESFTEREAADVLADTAADPRLATAVRTAGSGRLVVQTLAGGPLLVSRYEQPGTPEGWYARAVISAAMDARRLGMRRPVPVPLLHDAAHAYLEGAARIDPPEDWVGRGLRHASRDPHHGVTALAARREQPGPGPAEGYELHDYLAQHADKTRNGNTVPAVMWEALLAHVDDHEDASRLAGAAEGRLLHRYDLPLYRRCRELGGGDNAEICVVNLLARNGEIEELRAEADAGNRWAGMRWAYALVESDRLDELTDQAASGNRYAAEALGERVARTGDPYLGWDLRVPGADPWAVVSAYAKAANLLDEDPVAAEQWITEHALRGFHWAGHAMVTILDSQGRAVDALGILRQIGPTQTPQHWAVRELYSRLAERGAVTELRELAEEDENATWALCSALKKAGDTDGLRVLADSGSDVVTGYLCDLLVEHGELDEAAIRLTRLIQANPHSSQAAGRLLRVLVRLGRWDQVAEMARSGMGEAKEAWYKSQLNRNEITKVAELAASGDPDAATWLAPWYLDHDRIDDAIELARGTNSILAQDAVVEALVAAGRADDAVALLQYRVERGDPGDQFAIISLGVLLDQLGRGWEKYRLLREHARQPGSYAREPAARIAASLGDIATLLEQVIRYGNHDAARQLRDLVAKGALSPDKAAALLANGLTPEGEIASADRAAGRKPKLP